MNGWGNGSGNSNRCTRGQSERVWDGCNGLGDCVIGSCRRERSLQQSRSNVGCNKGKILLGFLPLRMLYRVVVEAKEGDRRYV